MALGVALRLAGPPLIAIALLALMRKVRRAEATVNLPRASVQKPWMKCSEGRHYREFSHEARGADREFSASVGAEAWDEVL